MSRENVEIVRRGFERWIEGGATPAAIPMDIYTEDVEWDLSAYPLVDLPSRGSGRDHLLALFVEYFEGWKNYEAETREFVDAGENVLIVVHERATIAESDVILERDVFHVMRLRDGAVVKWSIFETREEAVEAVGLSR